MRAARLAHGLGCLLAAAALLGGCGGSGSSQSTATGGETARSRPAPPASAFPRADGTSLGELLKSADAASELVVTPEATAFYEGANRYPFQLTERDGGQVTDAEVALYLAKVPVARPGSKPRSGQKAGAAQVQVQALDAPAIGPFPASIETLAAGPAPRGKTTAGGPEAARVVYSAQLDFPAKGEWKVAALIEHGGAMDAKVLSSASVGEFKRIPRPGAQAPLIHTPAGPNKVDYAEALGKEPIVLLFTTPQFCQSRVCGPVVEVSEQARRRFAGKAAFIQMDIYNDNDPARGVRPQVRAFHLPTEPWLFTIDRRGRISSAIEGAFGYELLRKAVEKVTSE